jgi:hypothetical protein
MVAVRRVASMKYEELDEVIRSIDRVLPFCGEESVCGRKLRKRRQELVGWKKRGGPVPKGTMLRIVTDVCKGVCEQFLTQWRGERK